jgi:hypothetical protein
MIKIILAAALVLSTSVAMAQVPGTPTPVIPKVAPEWVPPTTVLPPSTPTANKAAIEARDVKENIGIIRTDPIFTVAP